jgi:endonuclease/exonuclease/phosphatase family metal-dependent hydrolase
VLTHRLRIVTFNMAHGRGLTPIQGITSSRKLRHNLRRIAALLGRLRADVVALQEVDERSVWSGNFDHLDYIKAHAGYPYAAFGINNRRTGLMNLCYGNAILSRFPIAATETVVFGKRKVGEKGFLFTEIDVGGRIIPLVNLLLQLDQLVAWLRVKQHDRGEGWAVPPVVCGDFNNPDTRDDATSSLLGLLHEYGDYTLHPRLSPTFPSPLPRRALDFIFVPPRCRHVHCEVVRSILSDHRPVLVEFSVA